VTGPSISIFCIGICQTEDTLVEDCTYTASVIQICLILDLNWGHIVAELVEALSYKPEGRGFDARRHHWNFSLT
jgi:hypothetical protein